MLPSDRSTGMQTMALSICSKLMPSMSLNVHP
jgi:hypothetical protein